MSETIPTTQPAVEQPAKARRPFRLTMVLLWLGVLSLLAMLGWHPNERHKDVSPKPAAASASRVSSS